MNALVTAHAKLKAREFDDAISHFEEYLLEKPDDVTANLQLAYCLDELGQTQRAQEVTDRAIAIGPSESALREAIQLNPKSARSHRNLGRLLQAQQSFSEAAASFLQVVSLEPDDYESWMDAVRGLEDAGEPDAAFATVRDLLECKPDLAEARNYLGRLLYNRGEYSGAAVAFRDAAEAAPKEKVYVENFTLAVKKLRLVEANATNEQSHTPSPTANATRKNWHAFLELLCWLVGLALAMKWVWRFEGNKALTFLWLGLCAGFVLRVVVQKAIRGSVVCMLGVAFVIYYDVTAFEDFVKIDLGTWQGVLQGVIRGLVGLFLNGMLLMIPVYLRGRGGEFPDPTAQATAHGEEGATAGRSKSRKVSFRLATVASLAVIGLASFYLSGMSDAFWGQRLRAFFGSVDARNALGWRCREGRGVPLDFATAANWFEKAAKSGSAKAQYDLGILYYYGLGVPEQSETAGNWFERAAQQDYAPAVSMLGLIAANDQHDTRKAMEVWQRAVSLKDVWAEYLLGLAYLNLSSSPEDNQISEKNRTRALFWLEKGRRDGVEPIGGLLQQVWMMVPDESVGRVKGEVFRSLENGIAP